MKERLAMKKKAEVQSFDPSGDQKKEETQPTTTQENGYEEFYQE